MINYKINYRIDAINRTVCVSYPAIRAKSKLPSYVSAPASEKEKTQSLARALVSALGRAVPSAKNPETFSESEASKPLFCGLPELATDL
jgi:hypothetical protein